MITSAGLQGVPPYLRGPYHLYTVRPGPSASMPGFQRRAIQMHFTGETWPPDRRVYLAAFDLAATHRG